MMLLFCCAFSHDLNISEQLINMPPEIVLNYKSVIYYCISLFGQILFAKGKAPLGLILTNFAPHVV